MRAVCIGALVTCACAGADSYRLAAGELEKLRAPTVLVETNDGRETVAIETVGFEPRGVLRVEEYLQKRERILNQVSGATLYGPRGHSACIVPIGLGGLLVGSLSATGLIMSTMPDEGQDLDANRVVTAALVGILLMGAGTGLGFLGAHWVCPDTHDGVRIITE